MHNYLSWAKNTMLIEPHVIIQVANYLDDNFKQVVDYIIYCIAKGELLLLAWINLVVLEIKLLQR